MSLRKFAVSSHPHESSHLFQRPSSCTRRYNAVAFGNSFLHLSGTRTDSFRRRLFVHAFISFNSWMTIYTLRQIIIIMINCPGSYTELAQQDLIQGVGLGTKRDNWRAHPVANSRWARNRILDIRWYTKHTRIIIEVLCILCRMWPSELLRTIWSHHFSQLSRQLLRLSWLFLLHLRCEGEFYRVFLQPFRRARLHRLCQG